MRTSKGDRVGLFGRLLGVAALAGALLAASLALVAPEARMVASSGQARPVSEIDLDPLSQRSVVLAADGSLMAVLYREENRKSVPLDTIPDEVIETVLAVEDQSFWSHAGIDLKATTRALFTNVSEGDIVQGGSTVTQQLVKNLLLTPEQSWERKVQEAVLAVRLEDQMTKEQILERYLNTVYFGNGAYGLQAAAEVYYGKDAAGLDRAQAAFLAGLIRNPVGYDPFVYPDASRGRRDLVVGRLVDAGTIDAAGAEEVRAAPIPTQRVDLLPKPKDYFVEEVTRRLLDDPRLGDTQTERYNALFRGGLTIKTTLDPKLQGLAEEAVTSTLPDTEGKFTASVVSVEPGSGAVRAMVGGPGFETAEYNIATQGAGRQPGSSFKPFVLATALEQGISPADTINGTGPCTLPNPGGTPDPYEVDNYEGSSGGVVPLAVATQKSLNCAYARLGLLVGTDKVAATAERMGITTSLPTVPSMSLGSLEVLPIDMAAGYATLASDGVYHRPYLVDEVLDQDGGVVFEEEGESRRAISADSARLATDVLQGVVTGGTGTRARIDRPVAGKTGTTQSYADAWFVGYVPQLATAVWMGSPTGRVPMTSVGGVRVAGGTYPARIWSAYMRPAMDGVPVVPFGEPPDRPGGTSLRPPGEPEPVPTTVPPEVVVPVPAPPPQPVVPSQPITPLPTLPPGVDPRPDPGLPPTVPTVPPDRPTPTFPPGFPFD